MAVLLTLLGALGALLGQPHEAPPSCAFLEAQLETKASWADPKGGRGFDMSLHVHKWREGEVLVQLPPDMSSMAKPVAHAVEWDFGGEVHNAVNLIAMRETVLGVEYLSLARCKGGSCTGYEDADVGEVAMLLNDDGYVVIQLHDAPAAKKPPAPLIIRFVFQVAHLPENPPEVARCLQYLPPPHAPPPLPPSPHPNAPPPPSAPSPPPPPSPPSPKPVSPPPPHVPITRLVLGPVVGGAMSVSDAAPPSADPPMPMPDQSEGAATLDGADLSSVLLLAGGAALFAFVAYLVGRERRRKEELMQWAEEQSRQRRRKKGGKGSAKKARPQSSARTLPRGGRLCAAEAEGSSDDDDAIDFGTAALIEPEDALEPIDPRASEAKRTKARRKDTP